MPTRRRTQNLLTTGECAAILGVSVERIRQLDDILKPFRVGKGQRLFRRETVELVAQARRRASGAATAPSE